jgi:glycolate oxidase FAD binding subunit
MMDQQEQIVERVRAALENRRPLAIHGGNTKAFHGYPAQGDPLDVAGNSGVVEYDPGELVITCRAGSLLADIRATLKENGQHLPFDPPAFGEQATIGGAVACGFSGPGRPWSGSLRDYLLGVKLVNGSGAVVRYGGQVMKNVAGYDVSRLMAGSMGTLGVLLEVSFKVLPGPARELTLSFDCGQREAIRRVNEWSGQPLPLSGASWWRGRLQVRLSGADTETKSAAARLQAEHIREDPQAWLELREHRSGFFTRPGNLWRLSLPPATGPLDLGDDCLVDWGGAQRWYLASLPAEEIREQAARNGGHATLFRGETDGERFHPLPPAVEQVHTRIKQAFDPHGVFNPYRISRNW